MTVSIIIPALNEASSIAETIRHTEGLGFDEIIVVDGGSTDTTRAAAAAGSARVLSSPPGRGRQLNAGARAARGDVLLFLHADTRLPQSARSSIEAALADPRTAGGRFDVQFDSPSPWALMVSTFMNHRSRLTGIATGDQALFVRRSIFMELGGFAHIPLMEDVEFTARLKRAGRVAALRDRVTTSFRRWERQGPLRTIILMWGLRFLYWAGVSPDRLARFYGEVR